MGRWDWVELGWTGLEWSGVEVCFFLSCLDDGFGAVFFPFCFFAYEDGVLG